MIRVREVKRRRCTAVMLDYEVEGQRQRLIVGTATTPEELQAIREQAEREARRISVEIDEGKHRPKAGERPVDQVLTESFAHLERTAARPSTVRAYSETIKKFRRFLSGGKASRIKDVTPKVIMGFIQWQSGKAAATISGDLTRLNKIFRRCVKRGDLLDNPFDDDDVRDVWPTPAKHEAALTVDEFEKFIQAVPVEYARSPQALDYADYFLLLGESGLRLSEGLMLRPCDVNLGRGYLRVQARPGWEPKTKSSIRNVPLTERVEAMLRRRIAGKGSISPAERLFPVNWTGRSVNQVFNRVLARLGLHELDARGQKLRVHSFRHYYATRLVCSGVDPATVRDLLGHESIVTTNRYFNVPRGELFSAVNGAFARAKRVPNDRRSMAIPDKKTPFGADRDVFSG
ncbi:MAG: tyrosine-type recombinase/integrase [Candidatus Hydrogenedentales bacterium]